MIVLNEHFSFSLKKFTFVHSSIIKTYNAIYMTICN